MRVALTSCLTLWKNPEARSRDLMFLKLVPDMVRKKKPSSSYADVEISS